MAQSPVGLDITSTALIAAVVRRKGKGYTVVTHAAREIPHGIVSDGEVIDVPRLSEEIRALWADNNIKEKRVNVGIANQRCIVRVIDLPKIKSKSTLKQTLSYEVEEALPIPLEETIWDYHTVGAYKDERTQVERQRHVVVMAYRESTERFRDAVEGAGLKLKRIDLAAFAMLRASKGLIESAEEELRVSNPNGKHAIAVCDMGSTTSNLAIVQNGTCELNRVIGTGAGLFTQALTEQFGWSQEDANRVKFEAGLTPLGGMETPDDAYKPAREVMQYMADQIAGDLATTFDWYAHNSGTGNRVGRLVLTGEGSLIRGIEERLAATLGVPVTILDASSAFDAASLEKLGNNHAWLGTALGLAMEDAA